MDIPDAIAVATPLRWSPLGGTLLEGTPKRNILSLLCGAEQPASLQAPVSVPASSAEQPVHDMRTLQDVQRWGGNPKAVLNSLLHYRLPYQCQPAVLNSLFTPCARFGMYTAGCKRLLLAFFHWTMSKICKTLSKACNPIDRVPDKRTCGQSLTFGASSAK